MVTLINDSGDNPVIKPPPAGEVGSAAIGSDGGTPIGELQPKVTPDDQLEVSQEAAYASVVGADVTERSAAKVPASAADVEVSHPLHVVPPPTDVASDDVIEPSSPEVDVVSGPGVPVSQELATASITQANAPSPRVSTVLAPVGPDGDGVERPSGEVPASSDFEASHPLTVVPSPGVASVDVIERLPPEVPASVDLDVGTPPGVPDDEGIKRSPAEVPVSVDVEASAPLDVGSPIQPVEDNPTHGVMALSVEVGGPSSEQDHEDLYPQAVELSPDETEAKTPSIEDMVVEPPVASTIHAHAVLIEPGTKPPTHAMRLKAANEKFLLSSKEGQKVRAKGKGLKVDTAASLGYTPVVRGSIKYQAPHPAGQDVIVILDDDENEEISNLLHDSEGDTKRPITSVQLVDEAGTKFEKPSEEIYWRKLLKKAEGKRVEANEIMKKRRHDAGIASMALMIPLPAAERAVALEAMSSSGDENTIIQRGDTAVTRAKPFVTRAHLRTLQPGEWLNGSIIDYYMHCLREREKKAFSANKAAAKRSFFYPTAFYDYVVPTGTASPYEYSQVSRWTKRGVPFNSIFKCDALFFPCNIRAQHWIIIVAFMKEKTIQVFDSLHENYRSGVLAIYQYLQDEHRSKFNGEPMKDEKEWKLYAECPHAPGQRNGYDCGVFVCMYADYISNGWPLVFNQTHINMCRERIALGIMANCAVTSKAAEIVVDELWNMRDSIIFAVEMYRPELIKWLDSEGVPGDNSMGLYLTKPSKLEYGKKAFRLETQRDNLVRTELFREQQEVKLIVRKEEKAYLEAEMGARRLARQARKANETIRIEALDKLERQHLKRELKADELAKFIETMEYRLYRGEIERAHNEGEKRELSFLRKSGIVLNDITKKEQKAKLDKMSFKERSFIKLEEVSEKLIGLTEQLERQSQKMIVSKMLRLQGYDKQNIFDAENGIRQRSTEQFKETLKLLPQQRRADLLSQYGQQMWNGFVDRLPAGRMSALLPMFREKDLKPAAKPTQPDEDKKAAAKTKATKSPDESKEEDGDRKPAAEIKASNRAESKEADADTKPAAKIKASNKAESEQLDNEPPEDQESDEQSNEGDTSKPPATPPVSTAPKSPKKRPAPLPTHRTAPVKQPRFPSAELEDVSHLETAHTYSEFAGVRNPNINDYFGCLKAEELRKQEYSSVARRNRARQRVRRSPEEIIQEQKRRKLEKEEMRIASKERREAAALIISHEKERQDKVEQAGRDLIPMLDIMAGEDQRKAKKAKLAFDKLFPTTQTAARAETTFLASVRKTHSHAEWCDLNKQVREAKELSRLRYRFAHNGEREHFIGIKRSTTAQGEVVPFINPAWIKYHFHEKFVSAVRAYSYTSNKFVDVPIGSARDEAAENEAKDPPLRANVDDVLCHYLQLDNDYCMAFSFASALWYLGLQKESELVRQGAFRLSAWDMSTQIDALKENVSEFDVFERPIVWGQRKRKYLRFDILNDISLDPTMVIPWGGDGGMQHAITVVGHYIFDSTSKHALHLTQESLDWCCNTQLGYKRAYFAIRFPFLPGKRPASAFHVDGHSAWL